MPISRRDGIIERFQNLRVAATIRTNDRALAADAVRAAVRGGFRMVEFTLTTPGAVDLIAEFSKDANLLVGAGTVMTPDQAADAVAAGARFIVSPVCDPEVIAAARALDAVSIPGTHTPTEMATAHRCGADFVKLFPALADVADYIASILGPMPHLRIFPTNGVTPDNFLAILRAGAAAVAFVKSLFTPEDMTRRNFTAIQRRAADIIAKLVEL
ncbi:MAG TPA: 2-dehydro-3-deoxyphosphogluconate aldolase [Phycisphaerae bacterium]|nr:2-dehydro-3-deoxyphosphogluconate aldolase [Phycisphaerae bacterium]